VAPGVDARVARLVDRALEFSKEGRWPNMLAMRRPLQEVYQDLYGHPIGDAPRLIFSADVPVDIATQEEPSSVPALSRRVPTPTQPSPAGRSPPRAHARGVAIGGAAAVGLLVGTLLVLAGWHAEGRAQATSSPQPMSDPAPMPAPSIAPQPSPEIVSEPPPSPPVIDPPIIAVSQASAPKRPALSASPSRVLNAQAPMAPAPIPQAPMVGAPMAPAPIPQAPLAEVPIPQSPTAVAPNTETPAANVPGAQVPRAETPSAQSECSPPYVVDVTTGKKRWKLECL
jgi:nicotinate-nucleotide--dimethylbenzimidazole phosphoribosyltransferase